MEVDLKTMCELLGFSLKIKPIKEGNLIAGYDAELYLDGGSWVDMNQAIDAVERKLEKMVLDIIRVNRGLSNEDLAEIMLKQAQINLTNDLEG